MRILFMRRIFLLAFCVLLLCVLALPITAQIDADPIAEIDKTLTALAEDNSFSGSVLIAQNGDVLLSKGYGLANQEWNIPNTPETKFRIASLTKQFTAMAILLLQERGALSVEDPICMYVRPCPDLWADITLKQLLTHTSGIFNMTALPTFTQFMTTRMTTRELIDTFRDLPLDFPPGTDWNYSNSGYILLGEAIARAGGKPYSLFLKDNFFAPMGMADTGYDSNTLVIEQRAQGYAGMGQIADYIDMSVPYAAGALYSTVEDLYKWDQALFGGKIVSQQSWDAMLAAAVPTSDDPSDGTYAYGLALASLGGHPSISHGGNINGFATAAVHFTDDDLTVIVLSNYEQTDTYGIVQGVAELIFGAP